MTSFKIIIEYYFAHVEKKAEKKEEISVLDSKRAYNISKSTFIIIIVIFLL